MSEPTTPPVVDTARLKPLTIVPVWLATLVAAVLIVLLAPADDPFTWLSLSLGGAIVLTFVLQLAVSQKDGLVSRTMLSLCGSLVILAVATLAVVLVR
ncbi:hypothetical protein [Frigoribacterium faeni]|uniref:Uncharacterized protein n=1 Tax=Frigoribacterium faeni TaxID=145483 RepID=A0A7W3JJB3_9MICO|nr:hypothetical protein [Frigoribacterium faeni]MBA8813917.1 hypothetical protein [Frigoribacterium faeni]GEK82108.1 hypothetical protein FFA01_04170 [Frigoribacterium faeni]